MLAFDNAKPDIWESDGDFKSRIQNEKAVLQREIDTAVSARRQELEGEQARQTQSMRRQYEDALSTLNQKTWTLQGQAVRLTLGEYDRNARTWPFTVNSADPGVPMAAMQVVADLSQARDLRQAVIDLDTAVKAGALAGKIDWALRRNRDKGWYEVIVRSVAVQNLTTGTPVASWQGQNFVAYFTPSNRLSPRRLEATLRLSSPSSGARAFTEGRDLGALPLTLTLPVGPYSLSLRWADGKQKTLTGQLELGATVAVNVVKPYLDMVAIPGGSFMMGSASGGGSDERPARQVSLSPFLMAATEITQEQWQAVMSANPSSTGRGIGPTNPVNQVSWYDALVFCNKLSALEGLTPVYSIRGSTDPAAWGTVPSDRNSTWDAVVMNSRANGYRLPTEAQWEYAARGGTTSAYYWGSASDSATVGQYAWYDWNSNSRTQPVAQKQPNAYGLYDMSGNVWEWCWDWYGNYPAGSQTDPVGASSGTNRVYRGGSWDNSSGNLRSAIRTDYGPPGRFSLIGFRVVLPPSP